MKNKQGDIGWGFIVKFILGLLILFVMLLIAKNAKLGFGDILSKLSGMF